MIVVLWAAIDLAGVRLMAEADAFGPRRDVGCVVAAMAVAAVPMPLLAILIAILDRPGPVQDWYLTLSALGFAGLLCVALLAQEPACYLLTGGFSSCSFLPLFLVPAGLGPIRDVWWRVRPGVCAKCGRRAVISVRKPGSRLAEMTGLDGWCASCGAAFVRAKITEPWLASVGLRGREAGR
ncbi:hypothetical protein [Paludisphaera mucosa]|uniref:Uncharacterized protein n=1 Tax=Paludisphaera mucosa TaxID=3030827 RepID=A0ABT6FAH8_9BACT|nr:hypothetical protein [Paludisphaera mucosa]MDG3004532.1 hypothetical protein [Paludisphaera mucosa]